MKAKYRTAGQTWGIMDYPVILVAESEGSFVITGYPSEHMAELEHPLAGLYDVMEFEIFHDENND